MTETIVVIAFVGCSIALAQDTVGSVLGQPTLQKYINVGGGVDEINVGDLTIHLSIPLASKGSYGPLVQVSLDMDSRTYRYNYNNGNGDQIFTGGNFELRSTTRLSAGGVGEISGSCTSQPPPQGILYGAYDGTGTFHPAGVVVNGCTAAYGAPSSDGWALAGALENPGNGFLDVIAEIYAPSGDHAGFPNFQNSSPCLLYGVQDLHGNSTSDTLCYTFNTSGNLTGASGSITDAAGNTVLSASIPTGTSNEVSLAYPGPNGTTPAYTLFYTPMVVNQDFGCGLTVPPQTTTPILTKIANPDGSTESFTYESNGLHAGTITGRLKSVKTATGATFAYTYTGGTHGVNCSDGTASGITKVTPDGTWKITHTAYSGAANLSTTKVVAPSGDYTVDTISTVPPDPKTWVIPQMSTVASLSYASTGTLLASTYSCYNGYHPSSPTACGSPVTAPAFPINEIDTWTYVPGIANPALNVTVLDSSSRVTDTYTYDFGGTVGSILYDTHTQTAYGSWNGASCDPIYVTKDLSGASVVPLMDRVCYKVTYAGSCEKCFAGGSYYTYGTSGNNFGDVITEQDTIGGRLLTVDSRTYDTLGRLLTSTGPNGETTTSAYTQCSSKHLSSTSLTVNTAGATLGSSYSGYDCAGEKATVATDGNGNPSSVGYGSDPFWRPISTMDAAGNITNYTYTAASGSSPATVDVVRTIASGSSEEVLTQFDSMGRTKLSQVRQAPSSSQWTITETDYDSNGRVSRVTLPYSGVAGSMNSTIDGTVTTYDGLNRQLTVTGPAYSASLPGSTVTYSYNANDLLVTQSPPPANEHTKARQTERNGLGQVTSVCEVTTMTGSASCGQSTPATGFLTTYAYYPGGKLKQITQFANGSSQQVRSFTYDNNNTGRPLTTTTPESGTWATTYDSDPNGLCPSFIGYAVKTVDSAGGAACYQYDLADRVISEQFLGLNAGVTAAKSYVYDSTSSPHLSCAKANGAGKLIEIETATSTSAFVTINGSEQSVGTDAPGSGYVTINGTEKPAAGSTGTVSLNFSNYLYLGATITISVNGTTAGSASVPKDGSGCVVAPALASSINGNASSLVTATASPCVAPSYGTVQLKSKATGSNTNYSLGCSGLCTGYVVLNGMAGGHDADSGPVTITVNGFTKSVSYGSSSTSASIVSALANAFNGDSASPVMATPSSNVVLLTSKTPGANTDYSLSASSQTNNPTVFGSPSFTATPSGATLTGGTSTNYDTGTVWVTINGSQTSVSYGQGSTPVTVAAALVNAINSNSTLPVTVTLSGNAINLQVKSGSTLNTLMSGSSTSQPNSFTNPSFKAAAGLGFGPLATDELFCYDPNGRKTDSFVWTSDGYNAYGHINETYYPNGDPATISWDAISWPTPTPPTINYVPDSMGRPYSVTDTNGHTLVSSTSYYLNNGVNTVTFGNGDKSVYTQYANFAPNTATHTIGTTANNTIAYAPKWNSNGTLASLQTIDKFYSANSQTCKFSYDDLLRISTDNCGTIWNESFTYDPFGNITKTGSSPWPPMGVTYNLSNNQYYKASGNPFVYDANGRLLADTFDTLNWDVNGNLMSQTGTTFQYDAFDRPVSSTVAGVTSSYVYAPDGSLIATLSGSNHAFSQVFTAMPASRAVYTGSSLTLNRIDHYDWQNSVRVSSAWGRTPYDDVSYDAFGMPYWNSGTANNRFAGLTSDVSSGTELASQSRRYHPSQGRWESPDDRVADLYDPQSFNAYAYVNNLPTGMTDPSGHEPILDPDTGQQAQNCGDGTQPCDLSDFATFLQGVQVDAHEYPGYEVTYFPTLQVAFLAPAAAPVTNTPYQPPVLDPEIENANNSKGATESIDPWVYPQKQPDRYAQIVHDQEVGEMVFTLGTAWIGGALGPLSGAGAFTPAGPATTVDECVAGCFNRAILRFNNGEGLTPAQLARVAQNPSLLPRMVGTRLHQLLFEEAQAAARAGNAIRATPPFTFGPDIYDTTSGRWWDAMTSRPGYFEAHAVKYNPGFGTGQALYYGRFNCFVAPTPAP